MSESTFRLPKPTEGKDLRELRWLVKLFQIPDRAARVFSNECVYQDALDGHGISYLGGLITEYENLGSARRNHAQAEAAITDICRRMSCCNHLKEQLAKEGDGNKKKQIEQQLELNEVTWDDLLRFESSLLQVLPDERLRRRATNVRHEYREVAGEEAWKRYQDGKPPDLETATPDLIRADIEELLAELHWLYVSEPVQEAQRTRLLFTVLCGMFYLIIALVAAYGLVSLWAWWSGHEKKFPIALAVMFAGALGGSFSSLLRLQRTSLQGNAVVNLWKLGAMGVSAILSPFVGALCAGLLLLFFAGNFLEGQFFPKVAIINTTYEVCTPCSTNTTTSMQPATVTAATEDSSNLSSKGPASSANSDSSKGKKQWPYQLCICGSAMAKLLIWSFVAGFSERLVPDVIDRLGEKGRT